MTRGLAAPAAIRFPSAGDQPERDRARRVAAAIRAEAQRVARAQRNTHAPLERAFAQQQVEPRRRVPGQPDDVAVEAFRDRGRLRRPTPAADIPAAIDRVTGTPAPPASIDAVAVAQRPARAATSRGAISQPSDAAKPRFTAVGRGRPSVYATSSARRRRRSAYAIAGLAQRRARDRRTRACPASMRRRPGATTSSARAARRARATAAPRTRLCASAPYSWSSPCASATAAVTRATLPRVGAEHERCVVVLHGGAAERSALVAPARAHCDRVRAAPRHVERGVGDAAVVARRGVRDVRGQRRCARRRRTCASPRAAPLRRRRNARRARRPPAPRRLRSPGRTRRCARAASRRRTPSLSHDVAREHDRIAPDCERPHHRSSRAARPRGRTGARRRCRRRRGRRTRALGARRARRPRRTRARAAGSSRCRRRRGGRTAAPRRSRRRARRQPAVAIGAGNATRYGSTEPTASSAPAGSAATSATEGIRSADR